jgi:hypothetical protein
MLWRVYFKSCFQRVQTKILSVFHFEVHMKIIIYSSHFRKSEAYFYVRNTIKINFIQFRFQNKVKTKFVMNKLTRKSLME